jgi:glycosyltransferase involved in cell wall biosynthesis
MAKKISIVIPTYRRPDLLAKCLEALMRQNFDKDEFQIIVVSDGPDDATKKAVAACAATEPVEILHLTLPLKKGPAAARNLGWKNASADLIAFTDDDCIPGANWLQAIWDAYDGSEEIAFTGRVIVPLSRNPTDYELNTANLETAEFITANCICTRAALQKTGGFDERFALAWREDSDLHFKLLLNNIPIQKISATVVHPVRKAPWGISLKEQKKGMFNALLYKKYPDLYATRIKSKAPLRYYLIVSSVLTMLVAMAIGWKGLALASFLLWLGLEFSFIIKRLASTSRAVNHVLEMIVTSLIIPFLSVYWQFYGAWKYRVLFI